MKVTFKVIVCNQKSFNNLVITFQEEDFKDNISMEYRFYHASKQKVPFARSSSSWMNLLLLIYTYLFPSYKGKSSEAEILASRCLLVWVPINDCPFPKEQKLYKLELNLDAIRLILHPLLRGGMRCLSVFGGGILTNICLVSSHTSQVYIHVSRFVIHLKVWTNINAMWGPNSLRCTKILS